MMRKIQKTKQNKTKKGEEHSVSTVHQQSEYPSVI